MKKLFFMFLMGLIAVSPVAFSADGDGYFSGVSDEAITTTEIDTIAELDTIVSENLIVETEIDAGSELLALYDDETGTGVPVFSTSPTLVTPVLGAASATTITLSGTGSNGWAVVAGANTACNTTCTAACIFGVNTAATEADIVDCADATADECLCGGAA